MQNRLKNSGSPSRGILAAGLSALAASLCCIGPLVAVGLGVSGAGLSYLRILEPFRPWLAGMAILSLGYAFFNVYRKRAAWECEEDADCALPAGEKFNRRFLWIAAVLVIGLVLFPLVTPSLSAIEPDTTVMAGASREVRLDVRGMTCSGCAATIDHRLGKIEGIVDKQVSFEDRQAVVRYDSLQVSKDAILQTIRDIGYGVEIKKPDKE